MPWSIPAPADISDRYSSALEAAFARDQNGDPQDIDARSANSVLGIFARTHGQVGFEQYLYQSYLADELMVDTAQDSLGRHANIWGVPQEPAGTAVGNIVFTATSAGSVEIPLATVVGNSPGTLWISTSAATVPAGGTASIPFAAEEAGVAGNVAAGTPLALVSPIIGLASQSGVVDSGGLAGGTAVETLDSWRARILARIRNPPAGGAPADYKTWATNAGAAYVNVVANYAGAGTVGVIIAMAGPAAPNSTQISEVLAAINAVRPVTATPVVVAASLVPVNISVVLNPDTAALRTAVQAALALYFQEEAAIGGTIYLSALYGVITSVAGELSCAISAPAADVTFSSTQMPILGTITW